MIDTTGLFAGERSELQLVLRALAPDEWWLPTACGDWNVHDVALHLLGADINVVSRDRDQFNGSPCLPQPGDLSDWRTLVDFIDTRNEQWVDAMRRVSPALTIELLQVAGIMLDKYWPTVDLTAPGPPVSWAGPGPMPLWVHVAREYTERWTHQQHIRDATGRPGLTDPEWLSPVLETFMLALPHSLRETPAAPGKTVEVRLGGPAGSNWQAIRGANEWTLHRAVGEECATVVTMDQDTAWRLFTRGIEPAVAAARTEIAGNPEYGNAVLRMISIIA